MRRSSAASSFIRPRSSTTLSSTNNNKSFNDFSNEDASGSTLSSGQHPKDHTQGSNGSPASVDDGVNTDQQFVLPTESEDVLGDEEHQLKENAMRSSPEASSKRKKKKAAKDDTALNDDQDNSMTELKGEQVPHESKKRKTRKSRKVKEPELDENEQAQEVNNELEGPPREEGEEDEKLVNNEDENLDDSTAPEPLPTSPIATKSSSSSKKKKANNTAKANVTSTKAMDEEEDFLPISSSKTTMARKIDADNTQTQTQSNNEEGDQVAVGDDTAFFMKVLSTAGLLLADSDSSGSTGFSMSASFFSSTSLPGTVRSAIRGQERTRAFLQGLDMFLSDSKSFDRALLPVRVLVQSSSVSSHYSAEPSLIRLFLKVDAVQPHLIRFLLEMFLSRAMESDDSSENDDSPRRILQSLCWLDYVCKPSELADHLLESLRGLNDTNSRWLRDAVQRLPEILPDSEHPTAVERLLRILRETREHAAPLVDALADLTVPASLQQDLCTTVLDVLRCAPVQDVPVLVKFLLSATANADPITQSNTLKEMRSRLMFLDKTVAKSNNQSSTNNESSSIEALVLKEFHHGLLMHRALCQSFLDSLKQDRGDEIAIDIWLLVALSRSASYSVQARDCLKRIALKPLSELIFERAIKTHHAALEGFLDELIDLAASLLRITVQSKGSETLRMFATHLYRFLFEEMADARSRQEIVHSLVSHCGAGEAARGEVDASLRCLRRIVKTDSGARALGPFSGYVRSLLNDLDRFDPSQARYLFRVVARLALVDGEGIDELKILLRKLLMSPEQSRQSLGIVGTCQLVACLAPPPPGLNDVGEHASVANSSKKKKAQKSIVKAQAWEDSQLDEHEMMANQNEAIPTKDAQEALELIDHMLRETGNVLTFDEVARLVERRALHPDVVAVLSTTLEDAFSEWFFSDSVVPSNKISKAPLLSEKQRFALEHESDTNGSTVQIASILNQAQQNPKFRERLAVMCPMLRCLLACANVTGCIPDVILSCPLTLPVVASSASDDVGDASMLTATMKDTQCVSYFYACSFIRETVSSYAVSVQVLKPEIRKLLCGRFNSLVLCERELALLVRQYPEFRPPNSNSETVAATASSSSSLSTSVAKKGRNMKKVKATSTASTTTNVKKKSSTSTALLNGQEDGGDDPNREEGSDSSSSEDDDEDEFSQGGMTKLNKKQKLEVVVGTNEPEQADEPDNEEDEDNATEVKKNAKATSTTLTPDMSIARTMKVLRELSPSCLTILGLGAQLKLSFVSDVSSLVTADFLAASSNTPMTIHVATLRLLLDSTLKQLTARLLSSSDDSPTSTSNNNSRAFEYEPSELIEVLEQSSLATLRRFSEEMCENLSSIPSYQEQKDAIQCLELISQIMIHIFKFETLRRSNAGLALLFQCLRCFALSSLSSSFSSSSPRPGSFSEEAPLPVDAKVMIIEIIPFVFQFFNKTMCQSGVLSTSFQTQVVVVQLLRTLIDLLHDLDQPSETKAAGDALKTELSKLCKTFLKRDWGGQVKYTKQNLGMLVETFHDFSANPIESCKFTTDEMEMFFLSRGDDEGKVEKAFVVLDDKTLPIFYGSALSSLSKANLWEGSSIDDDSDFLGKVRTQCLAFSTCLLFIKDAPSSSNPNNFKWRAPQLRDAIRFGKQFVEGFVKKRMPKLSSRLRTSQDEVIEILALMQRSTRQMNSLCVHGKVKRDASILALAPGLKKVLEQFLLSARSMLKANNCLDKCGFSVGNLKAKNLDGSNVSFQNPDDEAEEVK